MSEWQRTTAGESFSILMGRQRSPARATGPNMTPYLRSANVGDGELHLVDMKEMDFSDAERERFGLLRGDVLVSEGSASAAAVGMAAAWSGELSGDVCFQNTLLRFRAVRDVTEPGFVLQWCRWAYESGAFRDVASGTNIKHIGSARAAAMPVLLPSIPEQRRIVDVMGAVDAQVRALTREKNDLLRLRDVDMQVVFAGTDPRRPFEEVATLQRGFDLPVQSRKTGDVKVLASNGQVGVHDEHRVSGPGVVTGRSGTIGRVFYVEEDFWPLNTTLYVKDFKGNDPKFVRHLLASMDLPSHAGGSTVPSLNRNVLDRVDVYCPPIPQQEAIADRLDRYGRAAAGLVAELFRIRALRSILLASLLNQDVEIPASYDALLGEAS